VEEQQASLRHLYGSLKQREIRMVDKITSSDSHMYEPPNLWAERISADSRPRSPPLSISLV